MNIFRLALFFSLPLYHMPHAAGVYWGDAPRLRRTPYEVGISHQASGNKKKEKKGIEFYSFFVYYYGYEFDEKRLSEEIIRIEEENKMPYVASWEKIAKKEGKKIGEKIGEKRGEKRGEIKGKLETARELVRNGVDINIIARATGFPLEEIEKLVETTH